MPARTKSATKPVRRPKRSRCELKSGEDFDCGLLIIDWQRRTVELQGIGGHCQDLMTPAEVLASLRRRSKPHTEILGMVSWKENADGLPQFCLYDEALFAREVYGPVEKESS